MKCLFVKSLYHYSERGEERGGERGGGRESVDYRKEKAENEREVAPENNISH